MYVYDVRLVYLNTYYMCLYAYCDDHYLYIQRSAGRLYFIITTLFTHTVVLRLTRTHTLAQ